ncbi:LysE family transporter [Dorea sp. D27]|uniref:LysE family transporter n=1 Tax=Dorea sp. D27 TaxID=658665 RepID=UPI0006730FC0|nr:LysE family transporter [Dorea sp. D27]KMZ52750.1 cysteine/O-acetylserine efflux protein [Dorea sp. D27]
MFSWIQFLAYAAVTAGTPGPNNIMSMSNASRKGFKESFPFNLGIWAGFSVIMAVCTLFCSLLSSVLPKIKLPMLMLGAAYMLYLAWKTFRSSGNLDEENSGSGFLSGFILQFINPKIYIYGIVSMEAYILPYFDGEPLVLLGFAMLLALIGFIFTVCWAAFGSVFRVLFSKYARITNTIMALLLVYCAVSLFI